MSSAAKYKPIPAAVGVSVLPDESKSKAGAACRALCKLLMLLALSTTILAVALLGVVYHGGRHFLEKIGEIVVPQITSDHPIDLPPPVHLSEAEQRDVQRRLEEFWNLVHDDGHYRHSGALLKDLVLTEREINGLICSPDQHTHHHHEHHRNQDKDDMCGKVYVTISEHEISADFSFPIENRFSGLETWPGRYFVGKKSLHIVPRISPDEDGVAPYVLRGSFLSNTDNDSSFSPFPLWNGTAMVKLTGDDTALDVQVESMEVFGWAATDAFVYRFFEGVNWAEGMCPHAKNSLKYIKGIAVGDGKVVVRLE
eukprot:CAMPEP_0183308876 /NCGR_PEP_ID=MMETSP0160_2-20130417/22793_1 /TAXON_ID=2839 ORGANISM="Odontella Sinensis, Strain Grunow 1884" /NCGR_SAMPLE_ID=MMETSP0160_2 /ASSEMBLY_ACC=CAM_ASM_000250 /LENGTH=310 /DNA_ID=CAMNT_0025472785 /DNA_START=86 /DNA_END=1018 /DNA_ORIENTATION=+